VPARPSSTPAHHAKTGLLLGEHDLPLDGPNFLLADMLEFEPGRRVDSRPRPSSSGSDVSVFRSGLAPEAQHDVKPHAAPQSP
jgi:hypothetical protein